MPPEQKKNPTIIDVARRAGVSKSTVSRILRGDAQVSESAIKRVEAAVAELNYVPSAAAQSMRSGPRASVGFLVRNIGTPAYSRLSHLLQKNMRKRGYHVVHEAVVGRHPTDEIELLENLVALKVQGIVVASGTIPSQHLIDYAQRTPIVIVGRPEPEPSLHNIAYDERLHGTWIAEHLHALGHQRIVVQTVPMDYSIGSHTRAETVIRRAHELGMHVIEYPVEAPVDYDDLINRVIRGQRITAMSCIYDRFLLEAWRAATQRDLRIPEDLSLFGSDGILQGVDLLGLSTIRLPVERIAERSAEVISQLIEQPGEAAAPIRELIPGWVLPGSTAVALGG